jgi:hypothetical protein
MNKVIEEITPWLEILENTIYDNSEAPNDFERTFCDGNELIDVYFASEGILVSYLVSSGATVMNQFSMYKFSEWLDKDE